MSGYIEKERAGSYFNPVSSTVEINPKTKSAVVTNSDENAERWKWLTEKWETMSFKERMSVFIPKMHYVNLRDVLREEFDDALNDEIVNTAYTYCRDFKAIEFDPDRQGIPNYLIIYDKINIDAIPDETIKAAVKTWGTTYGFITE